MLGAVGVIVFGALLGVIVTRGGTEPETVARQPLVTTTVDAAVAMSPDAAPPEPTISIDAPVTEPVDELALRCTKLRADRKWVDLVECAEELATRDPAKAQELREIAISENKAESTLRRLSDATTGKDIELARKVLATIPTSSVYHREASDLVAAIERRTTKSVKPTRRADEPEAAAADCDFERLEAKGDDYMSNGMDMAALSQFEAALRCKYASEVVKKAFLAACRSKSSAKAKLYFAKLPTNLGQNYTQICLRFGIQVP